MLMGAAVLILIVIPATKAKTQPKNEFPYARKRSLFTNAERSFLGVLNQSLGTEVQIFGMVRVADVITPAKGLSRSEWQRAFNRISAKHFDFVICDKSDLSVICVVELNDLSHQRSDRENRDQFLIAACQSANVPLVGGCLTNVSYVAMECE
ncbi:MAG: DUF2726 domain-containing protein [Ardenticatenaceae bacterium]|nr:DUF2726 domain-containing protein [Ardenticatenaceae bacterium]